MYSALERWSIYGFKQYMYINIKPPWTKYMKPLYYLKIEARWSINMSRVSFRQLYNEDLIFDSLVFSG